MWQLQGRVDSIATVVEQGNTWAFQFPNANHHYGSKFDFKHRSAMIIIGKWYMVRVRGVACVLNCPVVN